MKRVKNGGLKWIVIAIVICLVFTAGIGAGAYFTGRREQKSEGSKTAAQGNGSSIKDNVVNKDNSDNADNKDDANGEDNADGKDNTGDAESGKGGDSGQQADKQESALEEKQEGGFGTQGGSTYDASIPEDDSSIHTYEYILSDCTWQEAFQDCLNRGGYLARINSSKEYEHIRKEISAKKMTDIYFRLGGRRDGQSQEYYWVNEDNKLFGQKLNAEDIWCSDDWMGGEPSFRDGNLEEMYMDLFFFNGEKRFVWNDVPDDMIQAEPAYSGKLGYICEYE